MTQPGAIEYWVVALYFGFMLLTGLLFRKMNSKFGDYFRSGCRGTWWLVGSSVFMASFTAWTFTGAVGVAYTSGLTVAVIFMANGIGYVVNAALTAKWFRQMRAITAPEVIRERFGPITQQFYVIAGILPGVLTAALTLWGVALFTSTVFGFHLPYLIIGVGVVVLLYSTLGGLWGVMATDFLQALILLPMTVLIAFLSLQSIGGWSGFFGEIEAQGLSHFLQLTDNTEGSTYTTWWALAMVFFVLVMYNSVTASVKYFACKDGREAQKAAGLAAFLMFGGAILWFIPPIVARLQFSEIVEAQEIAVPGEAAYAVIATQLLPAGLTGLIAVAMFAATMSSMSTILNQFAAVVTQDIYKAFIRPQATDREMFVGGQIASFCTGVIIVLVALYLSGAEGAGLFEYMLLFGSLLMTPMVVPLFWVMFVRRVPDWAAVFSVCCSFVVSFFAWWFGWRYEWGVFAILFVGTASFFLTMPFYEFSPAHYRRKIAGFYEKMYRPVDFESEVGQASDPGQLKIVGYVSSSIGLFVLLGILIPNPLAGRLQILAVALSILGFGVFMVLTGYRTERRLRPSGEATILPPIEDKEEAAVENAP